MKAFWNKLCRLLSGKTAETTKKKPFYFSDTLLYRVITGDTAPRLISRDAASIIGDRELGKAFNEAMNDPKVKEFTINKRDGTPVTFVK